MINVVINDEPVSLADSCSITSLLQQLKIENHDRVAIAVNNTVVTRTEWSEYELSDNDQVMMFAPIQGG